MFRFALPAVIAVLLISCASKAPPPQTEAPQPEPQPPQQTTVVVRDTVVNVVKITDSIYVKEMETFKTLQKSIDSLVARGEREKAIELLKTQTQNYSVMHIGASTLQLASLLNQTGHSAEAIAILERFIVYKPAINSWIDSAQAFYDKIIAMHKGDPVNAAVQIDPSKLETINSLTAQIRNLKNANANSALITDLADSLRAIAPGDSVLAWLEKQLPQPVDNSDPFCEEQRKAAAAKFDSSRKNKAKAKALLGEAIEALDKCLARTPSADMKNKVMQNKTVLEKEMQGL